MRPQEAPDEFELLLGRCREQLKAIDLSLPDLEAGAPPRFEPPVLVEREEAAPPPPAPAAPAAPAPPPEEEREVFPPPETGTPEPTPPPREAPAHAAPSPAAPFLKRRLFAATAAAALAAGLVAAALRGRAPRTLSLDIEGGADAMAARPELGDLVVVRGRELLTMSLDGKILQTRELEEDAAALCWSQGSLWSSDGRSPRVVERRENDERASVFRLNHVPATVFVKDNYLWTAEKGSRTLHQYLISRSILGAMLQPLDSFELEGLNPAGIAIDGSGTLWAVDNDSRRLHRLEPEGGTFKQAASAPLSPLAGPDARVLALDVDGRSAWLLVTAGEGRAKALRLPLSRLDWSNQ